jgi:hypothetical protein
VCEESKTVLTPLSSSLRFGCAIATLLVALPASAQSVAVDTIPATPITPDLPLVSQPVPAPRVEIAQRADRPINDDVRRTIDDVVERLRDQMKSLDLEKTKLKDLDKVEKKIDGSMRAADWNAIADKIREASEQAGQKVPQLAMELAQAARGKDETVKVETYRLKIGGPNAVRGFNAVLVLGEMQGSASTADNVPEAAKKALTDMKEFLPYRSYRLLDAAWILGSGGSSSRMRGPDDQPYQLTLQPNRLIGVLRLHVKLVEPGSVNQAMVNKEAETRAVGQELEARLEDMRKTHGPNHPEVKATERKLAQLRASLVADGQSDPVAPVVVDTSFDMTVGETVVVGTSRLRGDKALILLLTAVPQPAPSGDAAKSPRLVVPPPGRPF